MTLILDLCCGCGGASLGFKMALEKGGKEADFVGVDVDKWALKTYQYNRVGNAVRADIRFLPFKEEVHLFDFIIACPPCPAFSVMTRQKSKKHETEKDLVLTVAEIISFYLPKGFMFENVPGIMRFKHLMKRFFNFLNVEFDESEWNRIKKETFNPRNRNKVGLEHRAKRTLKGFFSIAWGILDAVNYGVPQSRKRFIALGLRNITAPERVSAKPTQCFSHHTKTDEFSFLSPFQHQVKKAGTCGETKQNKR